MKVSLYKNTFEKESRFVELESILAWMKEERWEKQIERIREQTNKDLRSKLKMNLPAFTPSGTFAKRKDSELIDYSHLLVIDIDTTSQYVKDSVIILCDSVDFVYSYFSSPSGGLKLLVRVDSPPTYHRTFAFDQVKKFIEENSKAKVDSSGRNLSRLCYVSSDPELQYYPNCHAFEVEVDEFTRVQPNIVSNGVISFDAQYCFDMAKRWVKDSGCHYRVGNRNNYMHRLACILNRAGLPNSSIVNVIIANHNITPAMYEELKSTVSSVCRNNAHEFGTKPIMERKKEQSNLF